MVTTNQGRARILNQSSKLHRCLISGGKNPCMIGPEREPVNHPVPGKRAIPQASRQI
ncbi:MAG: hypothetical protein A4E69_02553 [Syntrophus sp. PtaB.Bin138]|nr:MAG: hypothetical protein A4E69_02553 [Syntrophus sp. PtaB.Bin138]